MTVRISRVGSEETTGLSPLGSSIAETGRVDRAIAAGETPCDLAEAGYERVDIDRYAVLLGSTVGYVEAVPPLFVCYLGHPYAKAIEIAQLHDFEASVRFVQESAAQTRSSRTDG